MASEDKVQEHSYSHGIFGPAEKEMDRPMRDAGRKDKAELD